MKNMDLRIVFVHHDYVFYYNKSTLRLQYSFFKLTSDFRKNGNVEITLCLKINVNISKLKTLTRSFLKSLIKKMSFFAMAKDHASIFTCGLSRMKWRILNVAKNKANERAACSFSVQKMVN